MKMGHVALMVCCLGLASVFLVNCGSSNSPSYGGSATATPTPLPVYTISGTVTYTPGGPASIYVLFKYQGAAGKDCHRAQNRRNGYRVMLLLFDLNWPHVYSFFVASIAKPAVENSNNSGHD